MNRFSDDQLQRLSTEYIPAWDSACNGDCDECPLMNRIENSEIVLCPIQSEGRSFNVLAKELLLVREQLRNIEEENKLIDRYFALEAGCVPNGSCCNATEGCAHHWRKYIKEKYSK